MSVEIIDCQQGTEEWLRARLGIPTASAFDCIISPDGSPIKGRGGKESKTRHTYMMKLLGERHTGEPKHEYQNEHTDRGQTMESEACDMYAFLKDVELTRVGFIRNGKKGCSPDRLIGNEGMLEIKTKFAHLQVELLLSGKVPSDHTPQLQGQLWVAEREWVDFVSYWPKARPFIKRVYRNEPYIKALAAAVDQFENELTTMEGVLNDQALHQQLRASIEAAARQSA